MHPVEHELMEEMRKRIRELESKLAARSADMARLTKEQMGLLRDRKDLGFVYGLPTVEFKDLLDTIDALESELAVAKTALSNLESDYLHKKSELAEARARLEEFQREFAIASRVCGNWREFPNTPDTEAEKDWQFALRAVAENKEARASTAAMLEKACEIVKRESNFAAFHAIVCERIRALITADQSAALTDRIKEARFDAKQEVIDAMKNSPSPALQDAGHYLDKKLAESRAALQGAEEDK